MSKELYDLCRRYKHFYKKQQDVTSWNGKYHDIDLSSQLKLVNNQVKSIEGELLTQLFKEFDVKVNTINIKNEMPNEVIPLMSNPSMSNPSIKNHLTYPSEAEVSFIDSRGFLYRLSEYMMKIMQK